MNLAAYIDHTQLHPAADQGAIERLCDEALAWGFWGVCVASERVPLAVRKLEGSRIRVIGVAGFPHGHGRADVVAREAQLAVEDGAREIDVVAPLGCIADGDFAAVERAVATVRNAVSDVVLKVILETGYFPRPYIEQAAHAAIRGGADYLKTSSGFGPRGADVLEVRWLVALAQGRAEVKASGGIADAALARRLLEAGASRLGCSRSVEIVSTAG